MGAIIARSLRVEETETFVLVAELKLIVSDSALRQVHLEFVRFGNESATCVDLSPFLRAFSPSKIRSRLYDDIISFFFPPLE